MESTDLANYLVTVFNDLGYQWHFKGAGMVTPNEHDMQLTLDKAVEVLYGKDEHPVGTKLEVGRLMFVKEDTGVDVYVLAGTINSSNL